MTEYVHPFMRKTRPTSGVLHSRLHDLPRERLRIVLPQHPLAAQVSMLTECRREPSCERHMTWSSTPSASSRDRSSPTVEFEPTAPLPHFLLGRAYAKVRKFQLAIEALHESVRFAGNVPRFESCLGHACARRGQRLRRRRCWTGSAADRLHRICRLSRAP